MIKGSEDINDLKCEKILFPFSDNLMQYLQDYVVPEFIAFYIASAFERDAIYDGTIEHINITRSDIVPIEDAVFKLFEIKSSLRIINNNPLTLEKIKYSIED
ncbi:MAG: hypothetical protein RR201_01115 [Malacoplasma sp.]